MSLGFVPLLFFFVLLVSGVARAQTVRFGQPGVIRDDQEPGFDVSHINYDDCIRNGQVEFNLLFENLEDDLQLEIWAGTSSGSCENDTLRVDNTPTHCWQLLSAEPIDGTYVVPIRDIIPHNGSGAGTGMADACEQTGSNSITVYFMLFAGNTNRTTSPLTTVFKYDLSGPSAPTLESVGVGEESLILKWDPKPSSDILGYYLYCEEAIDPEDAPLGQQMGDGGTLGTNGGTAGTGGSAGSDGGLGGTGGAGGTTGTPNGAGDTAGTAGGGGTGGRSVPVDPSCQSSSLRPGERPPPGVRRRGSASSAATEATAKGLVDGQRYACGIAAYDDSKNVGVLSNLLCGTPHPVVDYFEAYRRAGGQAGGGYCRFGRAPAQPFALGAVLLAAGFALVRRARRGASR